MDCFAALAMTVATAAPSPRPPLTVQLLVVMRIDRHLQQLPGEFERRLVVRDRTGTVAADVEPGPRDEIVEGRLGLNAILNDPGPLSIHDREMEERLSRCLLLLLQAEMTAAPANGPARHTRKRRK
jgi:hypothetical protein